MIEDEDGLWSALTENTSLEEFNFLDFHESQAGAPFVWMLGRIVLDFSHMEHQLKTLLWAYVADDIESGFALTSSLGTGSVKALLVDAAKRAKEPIEVVELISLAGRAFEACRDNRNILAHTINIEPTKTATSWIRPSRKPGKIWAVSKISLSEMMRVSEEIAKTATFLSQLSMSRNMWMRSTGADVPLPERLKMPRRIRSTHFGLEEWGSGIEENPDEIREVWRRKRNTPNDSDA